MSPHNILVLGVKGSVLAFRRDTGQQLWSTHLKSGNFVTVATDQERVYAHTGGELFCLTLQTGDPVWHNQLPGLGYGTASFALPGQPVSGDSVLERKREEDAAAADSSHSSTLNH
jgi:outer membrane protein assembly factor BamB